MTRIARYISTYVTLAIGIAGILVLLFAWNLPPFHSSVAVTDDAYIQGKVSFVASQLSGRITNVDVNDYQTVEKGDILVQIDDRIYRAQRDQAKANLDGAKAALDSNSQAQETARAKIKSAEAGVSSANANLANAKAQFERKQTLNKKQIATQSDIDNARATLDQAKATVEQAIASVDVAKQALQGAVVDRRSLQAKVKAAESALDLASVNLDNTTIKAPFSGQLGQVKARKGQFASAGSQLVSLVPKTIWVIANYKETQLAGMTAGQPVSFTVDRLGGERFKGHIERFSPATGNEFSVIKADNATGNFTKVAQRIPVRIAIDPGQKDLDKLVPGLSVVTSVKAQRG